MSVSFTKPTFVNGTTPALSATTLNPIVTALKTVCDGGAGSGVDADLVDGLQSSSANNPVVASTIVARDAAGNIDANGIEFPATVITSANANTLDHYEENTWTPAFALATPGTSSIGYAAQNGRYTRIGNVVNITCDINVNAFTLGTGSGAVTITGLPFTVSGSGAAMSIGFKTGWSAGLAPDTILAQSGTTFLSLYYQTAVGANSSTLAAAALTNSSRLIFSGIYRIAT